MASYSFPVSILEFDEGRPHRNLNTIKEECSWISRNYGLRVSTARNGTDVVFTVRGTSRAVGTLRSLRGE